jgi:glycine cleavage system regulatory protein
MTLLGGHFSLMIHIIAEEQTIQDVLVDRLRKIEAQTEISTHIFRAPDKLSGTEEGTKPQYAIRVRGDDRSGILYKTSSFLARRGVNILEMYTSVEKPSQGGGPLFLMYTRIEVPEDLDTNAFLVNLEYLASELHESMTLTRIS